MKIFVGWRAVGRAMRWARQRPLVRIEKRETYYAAGRIGINHTWTVPGAAYVVAERLDGPTGPGSISVSAEGQYASVEIDDGAPVNVALRILAALDLIPAELAETDDA